MPTSSSPAYRPGDVVVVPFPYSDRLAEKRRPALVISGRALAAAGFVWVAMITSAANPPMQHDQPISDPRRAGLSAPSVVRPVKVACIEPARILRRAGRLTAAESASVLAAIVGFVG
jgi:mRNA interferase MazF